MNKIIFVLLILSLFISGCRRSYSFEGCLSCGAGMADKVTLIDGELVGK